MIRTCQEFDYFHKAPVRENLTQILYLWAAENSDIGYKQGMNELLAVVLLVFDTERQANVQGCEPEFLRHDAYVFFDALMLKLGVV